MQVLRAGGELVGRAHELELLDQALAAALTSHRQTLLVGGEPGIGKTELLATWTPRAVAAGARLYWGRCREEGGAPVHWPWVQIVRALSRAMEPDALTAALGDGWPVLATAVPELAERMSPGHRRSHAAAADRFVFFDAMQSFLRRAAAEAPLVLMFDDLHAADASSLALLEFVSAELTDVRLLLLGTYRTHEASAAAAA